MRSIDRRRSRRLLLLPLIAGGVLFGVFAPTALADDPPVTTVPTPTVPTPVPAPTPPPPSAKKPAPKRSTPAPPARRTSPPPLVAHAPAQAPAVVPSPPRRARTPTRPKAKKADVHRPKRKVKKAKPRPAPAPKAKVRTGATLGASVGFVPAPPRAEPGGSFSAGALIIILGSVLAIVCFAIALVPATAVPWRPVAGFIAQRQLDLTLTGLTLLVAVLTFYFITGA